MDKEIARRIIRVAFDCSNELQQLLAFLKERIGPEDYKNFAIAVASTIDKINVALTQKALSAHPELAREIEANLQRSGRGI